MITIGTILFGSWGYNQTNVDFWQVVELTPSGKSVRIRKVGKRQDMSQGGLDSRVLPVKDAFLSNYKMKTKRIMQCPYANKPYVKLHSSCYMHEWDGQAKYETPFGYGH